MKAKLKLKYVGRFRNSHTIEEEKLVENKIDDKELKKDEKEEKTL